MNLLIIFCATYLIYISALFAVFNVVIHHKRKHVMRTLFIIFGSSVFAWVIAHVLKDIIAHPRPDLALALITPDSLYSFPSGHATFMFTLAFTMFGFDKRAGVVIGVLALFAGVARVLSGVHFWYDIVGGVVLAAIIASTVLFFCKRFFKQ